MKASRLKTLVCLIAFLGAPSLAIAGGILDRLAPRQTSEPPTGIEAGDMRKSPHHAVQGDTEIDDSTLANDVKNALKADAQTGGMDVDVRVNSGAVTLSGEAAGVRWKSRAEAVAASVKGVRSVQNNMKIGS
ncbi:MAG: BON domain-containing protein [Nitrosomonadales bacterium]|nr:BON domain-containing protein [Nitrosomonadales bacterium]